MKDSFMSNIQEKRLLLKNVRVVWPHLFEQNTYQNQPAGWDCSVLLPKDDKKNLPKVLKHFKELMQEKNVKVQKSKTCLQDGDDKDQEVYHGHYVLKLTSKKQRPVVMHEDHSEATEEDNPIYSGCIAHVSASFWLQNNSYGKRINSNLHAVMFADDADRIGGGAPSKKQIESDFEEIQKKKRKAPVKQKPADDFDDLEDNFDDLEDDFDDLEDDFDDEI